jgi:hypothetical protein
MPDCRPEPSTKRAGLAGKWIMVVEEEDLATVLRKAGKA